MLQTYYHDSSEGKCYWLKLIESVNDVFKKKTCNVEQLKLKMSQLVQNISLPYLTEKQWGENSTLPSYVQEKIQEFGACLRQENWSRKLHNLNHFPLIITLARSSDDGYTPQFIVESLQTAVLNEVHDVYCECSHQYTTTCNIRLTLDYGMNEGSSLEGLKM